MNANVNFIAMAYLRLSYLAVVVELAILSLILVTLNRMFLKEANVIALAVGVLIAMRLLEQSLPTILVSSGAGLAILFAMLCYRKIKVSGKDRNV